MTKVCIHLKDIVIAMLKPPFETADIGCAESLFTTTLYDKETVIKLFLHQAFHDSGCPVGGTIIDNEDIKCHRQAEHCTDDSFYIFLLIVGRDNN